MMSASMLLSPFVAKESSSTTRPNASSCSSSSSFTANPSLCEADEWQRSLSSYPVLPVVGSSSNDNKFISYLSLLVLIAFFWLIQQTAKPFMNPHGEARLATSSSIYFNLSSFLYIWVISSTALTILPHFTSHYNIVIASALYFTMLFTTMLTLLVGRGLIRFLNLLKIRILSIYRHHSLSYIDIRHCKRRPFYKPFRHVFKASMILSTGLSLFYAHCWSMSLNAFKIYKEQGSGAICRLFFFPLTFTSWATTTRGIQEQSIWFFWGIAVIVLLLRYTHFEFTGQHEVDITSTSTNSKKKKKSPPTSRRYSRDTYFLESSSLSAPEDILQHHSSTNTLASDDLAWVDRKSAGAERNLVSSLITHELHPLSRPKNNEMNGSFPNTKLNHTFNGNNRAYVESSLTSTAYDGPLDTLPMVPWFSLLAAQSVFDLLLQLKVFLGRFDARTMQPALRDVEYEAFSNTMSMDYSNKDIHSNLKRRYPGCYFYLSDKKKQQGNNNEGEFWIDFCADTGDGFNSSYQVARMLAQKSLVVQDKAQYRELPRGNILVIGGDLAYPDPTEESYEKRFFRTFEDAMKPPSSYRRETIATKKPALPVRGWHSCFDDEKDSVSQDLLQRYNGPSAFIIPGNHDWFDGLSTFTRFICHRDWLGGWLMPQQRSYFALKLPMGWWLFAFDYALAGDIDIEQFKFFAEVSEKAMKPSDAVIIVNHEPHWVTRRSDDKHERNVQELMNTYLAGKVRVRLAGDLHHYTRHTPASNIQKSYRSRSRSLSWDEGNDIFGSNSVLEENRPELIVSGGGGAFCHGTHTFPHRTNVGPRNDEYVRVAAFPSEQVSFYLGWLNILNFRWRNWRMDVVWAVIYIGIVSSLFPLCGIYADFDAFVHSYSPALLPIWTAKTILSLMLRIVMYEKTSLGFCLVMTLSTFLATDSKLRPIVRFLWGIFHGVCHIAAALFCAIFVECLTEWLLEEAIVRVPSATNLASSLNEYTVHFAPLLPQSAASLFFNLFDIPSRIAKNHSEMCSILCSGGVECLLSHDITRYRALVRALHTPYFGAVSLYFILLAIPFAGFIFGSWLALSLNVLKTQVDEGFSSLRVQHWKNFVKLHITEGGDLEIFGIGLHRTPRKWRKDPCYSGRDFSGLGEPSWLWHRPSKWIPERDHPSFQPDIVDYTCVKKRRFLQFSNERE